MFVDNATVELHDGIQILNWYILRTLSLYFRYTSFDPEIIGQYGKITPSYKWEIKLCCAQIPHPVIFDSLWFLLTKLMILWAGQVYGPDIAGNCYR